MAHWPPAINFFEPILLSQIYSGFLFVSYSLSFFSNKIYECSACAELRYFVLTNKVQLILFHLFEIAKSSQINACKGINLKLLNASIAHRLSARITKPFAGKSRFCDHLYYWRITRLHRTHTVRHPCAVTDPLRCCHPSHF